MLAEIYAAGENPIPEVSAERLAGAIASESHVAVHYLPDERAVVADVPALLREGDVLITLGAGSIWQWGDAVMERVRLERGGRPAAIVEEA